MESSRNPSGDDSADEFQPAQSRPVAGAAVPTVPLPPAWVPATLGVGAGERQVVTVATRARGLLGIDSFRRLYLYIVIMLFFFNLLTFDFHVLFMRPSSLGGGRILRRTLSVRLSVRPSRYHYRASRRAT